MTGPEGLGRRFSRSSPSPTVCAVAFTQLQRNHRLDPDLQSGYRQWHGMGMSIGGFRGAHPSIHSLHTRSDHAVIFDQFSFAINLGKPLAVQSSWASTDVLEEHAFALPQRPTWERGSIINTEYLEQE